MGNDSFDVNKHHFNSIKKIFLPNIATVYILRFSIVYHKHWLRGYKLFQIIFYLYKFKEYYLKVIFIDDTRI